MRVNEVVEELGVSVPYAYKLIRELNKELRKTGCKSRPPVIDGLLYSGAYILAGAPKIGKSFLVAQLAYHVSTGQRLWGYEVHQGTVLYLALEDDFQRIQSRMFNYSYANDYQIMAIPMSKPFRRFITRQKN